MGDNCCLKHLCDHDCHQRALLVIFFVHNSACFYFYIYVEECSQYVMKCIFMSLLKLKQHYVSFFP